ncbi:MAG: GNAT family N-acetyltransferase, partial [Deinococcus-Thermus bacterium]|nr:GNAT family N-acetyltransferase [Deinococcota bacterium]
RHVATDPAAARRGVGRALMWHIMEAARAERIAALDCTATRNAVPFYRAMGFVELGPTEVPLAPGIVFPAVRMMREL